MVLAGRVVRLARWPQQASPGRARSWIASGARAAGCTWAVGRAQAVGRARMVGRARVRAGWRDSPGLEKPAWRRWARATGRRNRPMARGGVRPDLRQTRESAGRRRPPTAAPHSSPALRGLPRARRAEEAGASRTATRLRTSRPTGPSRLAVASSPRAFPVLHYQRCTPEPPGADNGTPEPPGAAAARLSLTVPYPRATAQPTLRVPQKLS